MKELVNQELLIFQRYQIDVKISNTLSMQVVEEA
jgi:hypothetical protein